MRAANILHLGIKELRSLLRDPIMIVLIVYAFTFSIYTAATAMPETAAQGAHRHRRRGRLAAFEPHRRCLLPAPSSCRRR